jgi:phosphatidylinositol-binding clathrin assembly protein
VGKKYIDPIIAATWSEDGAIHDVCKALSPRFREPNSIVSSLISFHSVSLGTADTSSGRLQGSYRPPHNDTERCNRQYTSILVFVRGPTAEECRRWPMGRYEICPCSPPNSSLYRSLPHTLLSGYNAPRNLQHYALYLDTRIRSYRDLKHDAIRVQSETNRDIRLSMSIEEDARQSRKYTPEEDRFQSAGDSSRRKTIMGRKLRVMTVEKGLLRETKVVQKMMDSLIECKASFKICLS